MVFFSRCEKPKRKTIEKQEFNGAHSRVYSQLYFVENNNLQMPPELNFVKETIKYRNKTRGEFEKDSYTPTIPEMIMGEKSTVPGMKKAVEKSFPRNNKYLRDLDSLISVINEYERRTIERYDEENTKGMVENFYEFKNSFENVYEPLEKEFRKRGHTLVAATRQLENDFLRHVATVTPIVNDIEKCVSRATDAIDDKINYIS